MTADVAAELVRESLLITLLVLAPLLATVFATSFVTSFLQTLFNLPDATLSLAPRLLIGSLALLAFLPWMMDHLTEYSADLYRRILTHL